MKSKIAIVTGASRGLGKEASIQLASLGYKVIMTGRQKEQVCQIVQSLNQPNLTPAQLDVTDSESIQRLFDTVQKQFGVVDVLVNNAAIHYDTWQNAATANLNVVREAMETNVYGAWEMVQTFLPLLERSASARIVNVSSGAGSLKGMSSSTPAYNISKAALNALTLMLDEQLRSRGILVNAVCPGWVATDMGGHGGQPVELGAKGIVWAAILDDKGPSGGFFRDGKSIDW